MDTEKWNINSVSDQTNKETNSVPIQRPGTQTPNYETSVIKQNRNVSIVNYGKNKRKWGLYWVKKSFYSTGNHQKL